MISRMFVHAVHSLPLRIAVIFCNFLALARRRNVRFRVKGELLVSSSGSQKHFAGTPRRGLELLTNGLAQRGSRLRMAYLLEYIPGPIETVIDIGANSGDFLLALPGQPVEYLGIEPIREELNALQKNTELRNLRDPINVAASDQMGTLTIYVSRKGGDSSIIQPSSGWTETRKVTGMPLDQILSDNGLVRAFSQIDVLKVEAEGFEPEVLKGSTLSLSVCRYVVVDGGPERGPQSETTIEECANFLIDRGFKLVRINLDFRPGVALFENRDKTSRKS